MRLARNAIVSLILPLLLLTAFLPAACGGGGASTETSAEPAAPDPDEAAQQSGEDKNWSGWRWKGKRQECFFRHRNHCYDKLEAACRAARCAESKCSHDDAVPAVVTCRK